MARHRSALLPWLVAFIGCSESTVPAIPRPAPMHQRAAQNSVRGVADSDDHHSTGAHIHSEASSSSHFGPLLPREAASGPTEGSIACGAKRCKAGLEVCASDETSGWHCVKESEKNGASGSVWACDDASDCPHGQSCCQTFASATTWVECAEPTGNCALELCVEGEGAPCRPGLTCHNGACLPPKKSASCGPGLTCPSSLPVCLYEAGKAVCIDEETARARNEVADPPVIGIYACTRPSDCGGSWKCCTSMSFGAIRTGCSHACDITNTMVVCQSDRDCKPMVEAGCQGDMDCAKSIRCRPAVSVHDPGFRGAIPSWLKVCH